MSSYILYDMDPSFWKSLKDRAEKEGYTVRWIILRLLEHYLEHGLPPTRLATGEKELVIK